MPNSVRPYSALSSAPAATSASRLNSSSTTPLAAKHILISPDLPSPPLPFPFLFARHLGHNAPYHPTFRGFQSWLGLPYSGDMGCLDSTPQGCKPSYDRTKQQPACPALCPKDDAKDKSQTAIPLYDSTAVNCSGHGPSASCDADIVAQPFDPMSLNHQYAARATSLFRKYRTVAEARPAAAASTSSSTSSSTASPAPAPFFLYVGFAHTHTPLAYSPTFENASSRPGFKKVFGNTLAEVDDAIGQIMEGLTVNGLAESTLVFLASDNVRVLTVPSPSPSPPPSLRT